MLKQSLKCTFRASRFGRKGTSNRLYTLVNASPESTSGSSGKRGNRGRGYNVDKKSFVSVWDTQSWSLIKTRTVAKRPVTSFDISPNGKMLAIGGADLSVSIFEAENIRVSHYKLSWQQTYLRLHILANWDQSRTAPSQRSGSTRLSFYLHQVFTLFRAACVRKCRQYTADYISRSGAASLCAASLLPY